MSYQFSMFSGTGQPLHIYVHAETNRAIYLEVAALRIDMVTLSGQLNTSSLDDLITDSAMIESKARMDGMARQAKTDLITMTRSLRSRIAITIKSLISSIPSDLALSRWSGDGGLRKYIRMA